MRKSDVLRRTNETDITLTLNLDGTGASQIDSGIGFLDHMLTLFSKHARYDLTLKCAGDTHVDFHHSVEDIGICLGSAFADAVGNAAGITRYGDITLPMDETLVLAAVDISGRSHLELDLDASATHVGEFDTELVREFFIAFTRKAGITLHLRKLSGSNAHHIIEGAFKATARALAKATAIDASLGGEIPSTKGVL